jgi:hypothetical protein
MYKETVAILGVHRIVTKEDNSCRRKCNFKRTLTDVEEFRPPIHKCDVLMGYLTPSPPHSHTHTHTHTYIYMEASTYRYHKMAHLQSVGLVFILAVATLLSEATGTFCTDRPSFPVLLTVTLSVSFSVCFFYTPFLSTHTTPYSFLYYSLTVSSVATLLPVPILSHFQLFAIFRDFLFLPSFLLLTSPS